MRLTVLADPHEVRVVDGGAVLACHPRSYDRDAQIEIPGHVAALVEQDSGLHLGSIGLRQQAHQRGSDGAEMHIPLQRLEGHATNIRMGTE
jgi:hypothetical protein